MTEVDPFAAVREEPAFQEMQRIVASGTYDANGAYAAMRSLVCRISPLPREVTARSLLPAIVTEAPYLYDARPGCMVDDRPLATVRGTVSDDGTILAVHLGFADDLPNRVLRPLDKVMLLEKP